MRLLQWLQGRSGLRDEQVSGWTARANFGCLGGGSTCGNREETEEPNDLIRSRSVTDSLLLSRSRPPYHHFIGVNTMEFLQSYVDQSEPHAKRNTRRPITTRSQYQFRRMRYNLLVAALAFPGLISTQVARAIPLPQNIVSEIDYFKINSSTTVLPPPVFTEIRAFNVNPAPHVTNQDLDNDSNLVGTNYADAQAQWGNSANARFVDAGIIANSLYIANFTKDNDQDVLTTKISNTSLSISDFGSQVPGELIAGFTFTVSLLPGAIDGTKSIDLNPATNPSVTTAFDKQVLIKGRAGSTTSTSNDPFSGTFQLFGDHGFFTGVYAEDGFGTHVSGASYDLNPVSLEIGLDQFNTGEDFTVVWQATSQALTIGGETLARVQFWDPINGTPGPFFSFAPGGTTPPVSEPAVIWLFGSGLLGLIGGISSRKRKPNQY